MRGERIFVVDDDPGIARLISTNLAYRGFETMTFSSGSLAMAELRRTPPALVVLDILLPGDDGIEITRRIREVSGVPIMMVSAREDMEVKLEALNLGADDYMTKPFSVEELLARVRTILRRARGPDASWSAGTYHRGDLDVDLERSEVFSYGIPVKLSAREWAVLRTFVKYAGKVVTQRRLLQLAWGPEYGDEGDYVRTYVTRLRRKLEPEPSRPRYILTERGIGYRLASPN